MQARNQICQCARQARRNAAPTLRRQFATTQRTQAAASPLRARQTPQELKAQHKRKMIYSAVGLAVSAVGMFATIKLSFPEGLPDEKKGQQQKTKEGGGAIKLDAPASFEGSDSIMPLVIDGVEQVPTENGTIPYFPKTIRIPSSLDSNAAGQAVGAEVKNESGREEEYTLLGLGIRTVSFLSIQVYVVGLYIAKSDIPALQQRLVSQTAQPALSGVPNGSAIKATSLVPGEREDLKNLLLDTEKGEEVWGEILKEGGIRTAFRIVPTRNTDFLHLRDGWVRAITGRAQLANAKAKDLAKQNPEAAAPSEFADDSFGKSMGEFKAMMGAGVAKNVPKGHTLLLLRDRLGALDILYEQGRKKPTVWMGHVTDERLSRLLWVNYLAGKTVASESARKNIIEGVMGIVARPVGTVE